MRRRDFIVVLGAVTFRSAARAQQLGRQIVGYLTSGSISSVGPAFRQGMREVGYIEGQNVSFEIQSAADQYNRDLDAAFATFVQRRIDGLIVGFDPVFTRHAERLAALAVRSTIPSICDWRFMVSAGGLMSYGTNINDSFRQMGIYTGQILKGSKPADLPVVQSTKFELVINLKTAKALGLTIPPPVLVQADEVIE
jgi:putative ABC transport system substrate-binding protein